MGYLISPTVMEEIETIVDVLSHPGFRTGLVAGLGGAGLLAMSSLLMKRPVPGWGLVFAIAVASGLMIERDFEQASFTELAVLASAGILVDLASLRWLRLKIDLQTLAWIVVVPAVIWFTAATGVEESWWIPIAYPVVVVTLGAGLWLLGRSPLKDWIGPLMAISVVGAWVTVPETDNFTVILGVALPLGLATLRPVQARTLATGALATGALFAWLVVDGGDTRVWTILVGWATLATLPVIYAVSKIRGQWPSVSRILVIHLVYVIAITRVADYTRSVVVVVVWFVILIALLAGVAWLLATPSDEKRPDQ